MLQAHLCCGPRLQRQVLTPTSGEIHRHRRRSLHRDVLGHRLEITWPTRIATTSNFGTARAPRGAPTSQRTVRTPPWRWLQSRTPAGAPCSPARCAESASGNKSQLRQLMAHPMSYQKVRLLCSCPPDMEDLMNEQLSLTTAVTQPIRAHCGKPACRAQFLAVSTKPSSANSWASRSSVRAAS